MYIKNSEDINNKPKDSQWNIKNDIDNDFVDSKKIEKRDFFSWHKNGNIKYYDYYNAPYHDYFDIPPGIFNQPAQQPAPQPAPQPAQQPAQKPAQQPAQQPTKSNSSKNEEKKNKTTTKPKATNSPKSNNSSSSNNQKPATNNNDNKSQNNATNNLKDTNKSADKKVGETIAATEADVKNKLDPNNESINIAPMSNGNDGVKDGGNNNNVDGVSAPADKGKGLGTSQSNISSSDKTGNEPNSISGILIIILTILVLFIVSIVYFVHKKKLFKKDREITKEEIAAEVMNTYPTLKNSKPNTEEYGLGVMDTYQNITPGYSDMIRQDQSNIIIENYQRPLVSNISSISPVNGSFNYSSSGYDSSRQFIDSNIIKTPESAATSRIDHNYPNLNYY